jgi:hypothetical protein
MVQTITMQHRLISNQLPRFLPPVYQQGDDNIFEISTFVNIYYNSTIYLKKSCMSVRHKKKYLYLREERTSDAHFIDRVHGNTKPTNICTVDASEYVMRSIEPQ